MKNSINKNFIYGIHAVTAMLMHKPQLIEHVYFSKGKQKEKLSQLAQLAITADITSSEISAREMVKMLGTDANHQGIAALCLSSEDFSEKDLQHLVQKRETSLLLLILDGIKDPHNLGACLRSANAMAVDAVIAPRDKAVGLTSTVRKVASGAAEITPFVQVTNLARTLRWLKDEGIWIVGATEHTETRIDDIDLTGSIAIIMGSEDKGIRRLTKQHCDFLAKIEMMGTVESLNVSVASGIFLYEARRQRKLSLSGISTDSNF